MNLTHGSARRLVLIVLTLLAFGCAQSDKPKARESSSGAEVEAQVDPLPSWNDTATKARIIEFVEAVTDEDSPTFVPPQERVATFDNDGTLWVEQPMYAEMAFARDRVIDLAKVHPEWRTQEPFRAVLAGDSEAFRAGGSRAVIDVVVASHTGMSTTLFETIALEWIRDARHPDLEKPYTELAYQPQLELLRYL